MSEGNVLEALDNEAEAVDETNAAYEQAKTTWTKINEKYMALRGTPGITSFGGIKDFIMNNKGALMAAGAAFGLPVGLADSGAFSTITGLFGKLGGLFGIGG